jgi:hypothetical protein
MNFEVSEIDSIKSIVVPNKFFSSQYESYLYKHITPENKTIYEEEVIFYTIEFKKIEKINQDYIIKMINIFNNTLKNTVEKIYISTKNIDYLILCVNSMNDIIGGSTLIYRSDNIMEIEKFTMNKTDYITDNITNITYLKYKGLGNQLMIQTLKLLNQIRKSASPQKVKLYLNPDDKQLIKFYSKHGFVLDSFFSMERMYNKYYKYKQKYLLLKNQLKI